MKNKQTNTENDLALTRLYACMYVWLYRLLKAWGKGKGRDTCIVAIWRFFALKKTREFLYIFAIFELHLATIDVKIIKYIYFLYKSSKMIAIISSFYKNIKQRFAKLTWLCRVEEAYRSARVEMPEAARFNMSHYIIIKGIYMNTVLFCLMWA